MQTITQAGGDLFHIAFRYFGDAAQWIRIAQLNGLTDPVLVGLNTLKIPDPDPGYTGDGIATL